MSNVRLMYAYDPLCGWCYGLIPALRHVAARRPDLPIEVHPGGLFVGERARPYERMRAHIERAEVRLQQVTGRKPSQVFHEKVLQTSGMRCDSTPPSQAVLQMRRLAPEKVLSFAHRLQEVHYEYGWDLNDPVTYDRVCAESGFPLIDTDAMRAATDTEASVARSYARVAGWGVRSYPTLLVESSDGRRAVLPSLYAPDALLAAVDAHR